MPVFQLLYASGAAGAVSADDIASILVKSRHNNGLLGVTGMLLYANRTFIQVLEGEAETVRKLARRISHDPRHRNYMVLFERMSAVRVFSQWQMGFRELDPGQPQDGAIFRSSREALEARVGGGDQHVLLDTILAFAGREFLAA